MTKERTRGVLDDSGFPKLNAKISAMEYVRDANGDLYLDHKGNPIPSYQNVNYNGEHYEYHTVTDAEAAMVMDLLESAQFVPYDSNVISAIINEETAHEENISPVRIFLVPAGACRLRQRDQRDRGRIPLL